MSINNVHDWLDMIDPESGDLVHDIILDEWRESGSLHSFIVYCRDKFEDWKNGNDY